MVSKHKKIYSRSKKLKKNNNNKFKTKKKKNLIGGFVFLKKKKSKKIKQNHNLNNTISIPVSIPVSYINTQEISKLQLFNLGFSNKKLFRKKNNEMLLFIYNRHNKNKLYLHNKGFVVFFYKLRSKDIIESGRFADPATNNNNKIKKDEENNKRRRFEFQKQINFTHFDYKENKKSKTNELTFYFKNKKKDKIYNCKEVFENLYRYLTRDKTSLLHNMYLIFNINNETFYGETIRIRIDDLFNLLLKTRNFKLKLMDLLEHTMFIEEVLSKKGNLKEINSNKSNKKYNYFKEVPKFFKIDKLTDIQLNQESLDKKNTDILLNNVMLFIFKNIKHIKNASKNTYKLTEKEIEYIVKRINIVQNNKAKWLKITNDAKKRYTNNNPNPLGYQSSLHNNNEYSMQANENTLNASRRREQESIDKRIEQIMAKKVGSTNMKGGLSYYSTSKTKKSFMSEKSSSANKSSRTKKSSRSKKSSIHKKSNTNSNVNYLEFTLNFN